MRSPTGKLSDPTDPTSRRLDSREERFVEGYLVHLNPEKAALDAGYSPTVARTKAYQWVSYGEHSKPHLLAAIQSMKIKRMERVNATHDDVIERLSDIALTDSGELMELRRVCCRFCYGKDGLYQERPAERHARWQEHQALLKKVPENKWHLLPPFDDLGGVGYDSRRPPVETCCQCEGEGELQPFVKDTRALSKSAARAFAGFRQTREGVEVKVHDQTKALELLGRHYGMFADRQIHQNPDGSPVEPVGAIMFVGHKALAKD